jgi:hypothetical protein
MITLKIFNSPYENLNNFLRFHVSNIEAFFNYPNFLRDLKST